MGADNTILERCENMSEGKRKRIPTGQVESKWLFFVCMQSTLSYIHTNAHTRAHILTHDMKKEWNNSFSSFSPASNVDE